jgi:large subunit ribosomal protein L4
MAKSAPKLAGSGGDVVLDATAFEAGFNMPLVHETVRAELNARRQGTASTKTRGQVSGGGAKPWRQKGTGRARAGSSRSPVWTGGGTVFGPQPRHYTVKVNRKARKAALRSALSVHADRGSLAVFDASSFDGPATKQAAGLLSDWGADTPTLVLLTETEADAGLSFRNLVTADVMPAADAGVADIIRAASLLISEAAMSELVARAIGATEEETA